MNRIGRVAKRKNPAAVALGRLGGKAAAGRGAKKAWADVSPEERSRRMRALVLKRWKKAKKA
jgi:hypothetical protein